MKMFVILKPLIGTRCNNVGSLMKYIFHENTIFVCTTQIKSNKVKQFRTGTFQVFEFYIEKLESKYCFNMCSNI